MLQYKLAIDPINIYKVISCKQSGLVLVYPASL